MVACRATSSRSASSACSITLRADHSRFLPLFSRSRSGLSLRHRFTRRRAESISGLLKLFAGYFSDRRGRRKGLVVFGYALGDRDAFAARLRRHVPQVLGLRLADRVGKGVRSAPRDAMMPMPCFRRALWPSACIARWTTRGGHRATARYACLSLIASDKNMPAAGDYKTIFLLASLPALAAVVVAAFFVRETRREQRTEISELPRLSLRGFNGNFKRFLVIVALFTLSNSSDAFLLLACARGRHSGPRRFRCCGQRCMSARFLSSLVGEDLSDRLGRRMLIASGWLLYAAVYAGFAFISTVGAAWTLFLIYGIYFGLVEGAEKALVADLVRPEQRGTAYGLYNLAFSITVFPASLLMARCGTGAARRSRFSSARRSARSPHCFSSQPSGRRR